MAGAQVDDNTWRRPRGSVATQLSLADLGTPLIATTFVVLDLETTGLSPDADRITEVGAVKVRGGEVLGELRTFVHPGRPIPAAVTAVTGITDAMVASAPSIAAVIPIVRDFLAGAVLVAHNARFDVSFLRAAAAATEVGGFDPVVVDTARLARRLLVDEVRDCRLATLATHLRAATSPGHRALVDARATVDVLHGLLERAGSHGATTVEDLRDLERASSPARFKRLELVRDAPAACGVYRFLAADDTVLYVGKATDLRARLRTYFTSDTRRRIADLVRDTARVTWTITPTLLEAEVVEVRAIHAHRPAYNRRSKTPERAVHLALTGESFPRLSVVRAPGRAHRRTVGPLPSRKGAERLAEAITEVIPLRTCTPKLRRAQDHPACVLKDLGRCGAPCDGTQSRAGYAEVVARVEAALDGPDRLFAPLRTRMLALARDGRFERAGEIRTRLHGAARALAGARERAALVAVDELVATRPDGDDLEVAVVRRGRLIGTVRVPRRATEREIENAVTHMGGSLPGVISNGSPGPEDAEEVALVLAWLARPDVRAHRVEGTYASAVAGGAALDATLREARGVDRARRRDRQALAGTKVVRRASTG